MATIYELEKRLANLENLVDYLSKQITNHKQYSDADMAGARQSISQIEPTTYTKTVGIGETEVTFTDIANGNISVFIEDNEGKFPPFDMDKSGNILTVYFEPLENVATITVSII